MRTLFDALIKAELAHDHSLVFATEDGAGAAVWHAPNEWKLSNTEMLRALPAIVRAFRPKSWPSVGLGFAQYLTKSGGSTTLRDILVKPGLAVPW